MRAAQSAGLVGAVSARTRAIVGKGCHGTRCDACDGEERPWHMASESVWRPRYARDQRAVMRGWVWLVGLVVGQQAAKQRRLPIHTNVARTFSTVARPRATDAWSIDDMHASSAQAPRAELLNATQRHVGDARK